MMEGEVCSRALSTFYKKTRVVCPMNLEERKKRARDGN
jgi:hypothetical protein